MQKRKRPIRPFNFFGLPREVRDIVYEEVLRSTRQVVRFGELLPKYLRPYREPWQIKLEERNIKDLLECRYTFFRSPVNDKRAEHVPFGHRDEFLKRLLASNKQLKDECESRMFDLYQFHLLLRLSFRCDTAGDVQTAETQHGFVIPRTSVIPSCEIGPQLPSPAVWERIKNLRLEILLDGNPDVELRYLSVLYGLKHLYLKMVWLQLKFTHHSPDYHPRFGDQWCPVHWQQEDIDKELVDPRWENFLSDIVTFVPNGVKIHILDGDGWSREDEGANAVVVKSMKARINRVLNTRGRELAQ